MLTSVKNALVLQYAYLFGLEDVVLHVSENALRAIARQAMRRRTGARGLRSIMENLLKEAMFEVGGEGKGMPTVEDGDGMDLFVGSSIHMYTRSRAHNTGARQRGDQCGGCGRGGGGEGPPRVRSQF